MKHTTKAAGMHMARVRVHGLVVVSCLVLGLLGRLPESSAGWVSCPPQVSVLVVAVAAGDQRSRWERVRHRDRAGCGDWVWMSWPSVAVRSLTVAGLWRLVGCRGPCWLVGLPWLVWAWQVGSREWPGLNGQPEWRLVGWLLWQGQRLALLGCLGHAMSQVLHTEAVIDQGGQPSGLSLALGLGCVVGSGPENRVSVARQTDGSYQAEIEGHFTLQVGGDDPFRARLLLLFMRQLTEVGPSRRGGRTQDGRAPFVRQVQIAEWFGMAQPNVSRLERYWRAADWPNLLSSKAAEVLTPALRERVVAVFPAFPWWHLGEVYHHLREQGVAVTYDQVCQVARESGWLQLRQALRQRYQWSAKDFRPRDEWLVRQLLSMVDSLVGRLEASGGVPSEERLALNDLHTLAAEVGVAPAPPLKALPWLLRVEQVLFGEWQAVEDGQVRCIYCGSTHVVCKSKRPRWKTYYDAEGQVQRVAVYRYYCRNRACSHRTFTNLPPGLVPYSRYRTEVKLRAVQMYAWGYSTYRRTGRALGVKSMTVYRWVSAWGYELLPVAALFGVVKSSGVVGVDEKYVLVPKNDKPAGDMRRWMYVYLAVDVYTHDLLHIAIYANNDKETALTFLLALRAKGYHPHVVVTDLRRDYGPDIARVFPTATHHECIFHALKDVAVQCRTIYGPSFAQTHPEVEDLRQAIQHIFAAKTKRTAQKRYQEVLALRATYVQATPGAAAIFDFLERHWPKLVNAIESQVIPRTNNAVELVIRRFDQHYQSFCGFESIETAHIFLGVFEKLYRLTPFSDDAQPAIRGKCPLELAGYDVRRLPVATLWNGLSVEWPVEARQIDVPIR
jgi:transposase-like protein